MFVCVCVCVCVCVFSKTRNVGLDTKAPIVLLQVTRPSVTVSGFAEYCHLNNVLPTIII